MDIVPAVRAVPAAQWICGLRRYGVLAIGWIVFILYAYPGVMTMDSFDQLFDGRARFYTDSHPPAMAALWGLFDRVVPGPFPMLALQGTCLLAGLYLILCRVMRRERAAIAAVVVFLFPPVLVPMAVIWKDCVMAGFLVLGIAALFDDRRWVRLVGLGAFAAATAMRYNAFAATLPLVVMLFEWQRGQRWLVRTSIAVGAWIAVTGAAFAVNTLLVDREMHFWSSSLALADITGTLTKVDRDLPDDTLRPLLAPTQIHADHDFHATVRAHYKPGDFALLIGGASPLWTVPISGVIPAPEGQRDAIGHAWWEIVSRYPGAYLRYRFNSYAEVLGLRDKFEGATVIRHHAQVPELVVVYNGGHGWTAFQNVGERLTTFLAKRTRLFRPHIYVLLALILLVIGRRHGDIASILISGLVMELSLLPLAVTPDYRYSHWMVTCTCVALVMLIARRARPMLSSAANR